MEHKNGRKKETKHVAKSGKSSEYFRLDSCMINKKENTMVRQFGAFNIGGWNSRPGKP